MKHAKKGLTGSDVRHLYINKDGGGIQSQFSRFSKAAEKTSMKKITRENDERRNNNRKLFNGEENFVDLAGQNIFVWKSTDMYIKNIMLKIKLLIDFVVKSNLSQINFFKYITWLCLLPWVSCFTHLSNWMKGFTFVRQNKRFYIC